MLRLCAIRTFFLDPRAALWIAAPYFYSCNNTGGNVSASSLSSLLSVTVSVITVANMADVLAVVFFFIPSSHRLAQTLNAERNSRLPSLIFFFFFFLLLLFFLLYRDGRCCRFAHSRAFMIFKRGRQAGVRPPPLVFRCVRISLLLSPVHRRAVRTETRTMSTPTNPEVKELSPVDFIQLQQYIECEYRRGGGWAAFSA